MADVQEVFFCGTDHRSPAGAYGVSFRDASAHTNPPHSTYKFGRFRPVFSLI